MSPRMAPDGAQRSYRIFGVTLATDYPLRTPLPETDDPPELFFTCSESGFPEPPPPKATPDYVSRNVLDSGVPFMELYRGSESDLLRFREVADFRVSREAIRARLFDPAYAHMVEIHLLGTVFSYWMERRGIPVLHAAAVAVDGRAIGFMATNRGGKSSLAASLMQAGHPMLSDDLVAIQRSDEGFEARPGYPSMRLWPDQAAHFDPEWERLPIVHPRFSKRRLRVGTGGFGRFLDAPLPLSALYLPDRRDADGGEAGATGVTIEPLPQREAVIELIRGSFLPELLQVAGFAEDRLRMLAGLAEEIPVRRLGYPEGMHRLPRVRDRILDDARSLVPSTRPGGS